MKVIHDVVEVSPGKKVTLSNLEKLMWPKESITKRDLVEYYATVAPYMTRFLRARPLMLRRYPNGVSGKSFVQKDWAHHPDWVKTVDVEAHGMVKRSVRHVVCNDMATLVWLAEMASIEINQFLSSGPNYEQHDLLLIDLDPHAPAGFDEAVEIALAVESILKHMRLKHLIKTTGHDGLHFLVPIVPEYSIEVIRRFAYLIGVLLEKSLPKIATTSRRESDRPGKVYVDYYQNGLFRTVAAPYTLRPVAGALVSFPIRGQDLRRRNVRPGDFDIRTVPSLLKEKRMGDLDLGMGQRLEPGFRELGATV